MALFKLTDRERGQIFFEEIDLEAQLLAVRSLLARNREADAALAEDIKSLEDEARAAEEEHAWIVEDMWVGQMEASVYQDAANSMAAVGMLAPLFEALFANLFRSLGRSAAAGLDKSERASRADLDYWDPHFVFGKDGRREDLVAGIQQLARDVKLNVLMPTDYAAVLTALFTYRNMMFHNGFEWPIERRDAFAKTIQNQNLAEAWFSKATRNDEPWIYYMSPEFVSRCLTLVDEILTAVGRLTWPEPPKGTASKS